MLFWTSPVFTALMSKYYLNEILSIFDWIAVIVAFFGLLIIQNPFGEQGNFT